MNKFPSFNLMPMVKPLTPSELMELYKPPARKTSEATSIQVRFDEAFYAEMQAAGVRPAYAILGAYDYDTLRGYVAAFLAEYGVKMKPAPKASYFEFKGVRIFKSHSMTTGIVMGGEEP